MHSKKLSLLKDLDILPKSWGRGELNRGQKSYITRLEKKFADYIDSPNKYEMKRAGEKTIKNFSDAGYLTQGNRALIPRPRNTKTIRIVKGNLKFQMRDGEERTIYVATGKKAIRQAAALQHMKLKDDEMLAAQIGPHRFNRMFQDLRSLQNYVSRTFSDKPALLAKIKIVRVHVQGTNLGHDDDEEED